MEAFTSFITRTIILKIRGLMVSLPRYFVLLILALRVVVGTDGVIGFSGPILIESGAGKCISRVLL